MLIESASVFDKQKKSATTYNYCSDIVKKIEFWIWEESKNLLEDKQNFGIFII